MRPIRLEIEGFGTFRDRTVVEFADVDLVAFVGPTGSGKSTVIDAITFALYGSVARYDNPSLVAPVIHQLSTEAKVRFDFDLAGQTYAAVRVVRRQKARAGGAPRATTKEARLERLGGGGPESTVLAGNVRELDEQIKDLIGLDFRQFTRTIVLPQGDFAEFLTDDPASRQALLRRLLDIDVYAKMGALARERASRAAQQLEVYEPELERLAHVTPERIAEATHRLEALREFEAAIASKLTELATINVDLDARRAEVVELDANLDALQALETPTGVGETDAKTAVAKRRVVEAEGDLAEARARRDRAAEEQAGAGDPLVLASQLTLRERDDELAETLAAAEAALVDATEGRQATLDALAEATSSVEEAAAAAATGRISADAADWVAKLVEGEPCPVCQQVVTAAPDHPSHDQLLAVEQAEADARATLANVTKAAARAEARVESIEAGVAAATDQRAELHRALDAVPDGAELRAAIDAAAALVERLQVASGTVKDAEAALDVAGGALIDAEREEERLRATYLGTRDQLARLDPPLPTSGSLADDWGALLSWRDDRVPELETRREKVASAGKTLAAAKASLVASLADGAAPFGLDPDPGTLATQAGAAVGTAASDLAHLTEQLEHVTDVRAKVDTLRASRAVDGSLGRQHLSAAGFERWLLTEALDDMVTRATERLFELSIGRYSLEATDGSFNVCDHGNADERRDVRTLSGGEMFLASLALALALADSIAELAPVDSPRLESIFLDEGFGTLDGETLDVLASAIEELSATGRLVAIVTHVRDLADRMPVRFEVRKGPTTSTIERSEH